MCRLLGILSPDEEPAAPWLLQSDNSLLRQAHINPEHIQGEGWGIAWWDPKGIRLERGIAGAFEKGEIEHYRTAAGQAKGPLVISHLRKASNPLKLPREQLVGLVNSQPFLHGQVLFAHNGSIPLPKETQARLQAYGNAVQGVNDSEVFFYLLLESTEKESDPVKGYTRALGVLNQVWETKGRPGKFPYSGLNVLFSRSKDELWAFCHYNGDHGKSIGGCDCPYYQMCFRDEGGTIVVASEPMDTRHETWEPLVNGTYLHAERKGRAFKVRTGKIPLP